MRLALTLLLLLAANVGTAQSPATISKWEFAEVKDDFAGKSDQRLVLKAEDSSSDRLGDSTRAHIIVACGKIFRGHGGKTLIFDAGIPIQGEFRNVIGELTTLKVRSDNDEKPKDRTVQFYDRGNSIVYLGDAGGFFFSKSMFQSMLASSEFRIRFNPLLGNTVETVVFDVRGLADALSQLDQCKWPTPNKP